MSYCMMFDEDWIRLVITTRQDWGEMMLEQNEGR